MARGEKTQNKEKLFYGEGVIHYSIFTESNGLLMNQNDGLQPGSISDRVKPLSKGVQSEGSWRRVRNEVQYQFGTEAEEERGISQQILIV